jgi:phage repressor protein C with HTH and peptisase S24 domain
MFFFWTNKETFVLDLLQRLEERARETGESEKQFAMRIGMSEGLFKNLRAGSMPSADRLDVILRELGMQVTLGASNDSMRIVPASPPSTPPSKADQSKRPKPDFVAIPVHDAVLAAGAGALNGTETIVDHLVFKRDWLRQMQLVPGQTRLVKAVGESMEPTIRCGDMLLVDCSRASPPSQPRQPGDNRPARIFALLDELGARVKRIERLNEDTVLLLSDNPAHPPETKSIRLLSVIGEVVWWAHSDREL